MKFLLGVFIGVLLLPICGLAYLLLGLAPVATSAPPLPGERLVTSLALHKRIDKEAPEKSPYPVAPAGLIAGAHVYHDQCAFCHGLKGQPKPAAALGEFPAPPQLFEHIGVTDDPAGETFWKVSNGIRLTGMPGYKTTLTDEQMWHVSQMLATTIDKLPPEALEIVSKP
jgi:mono/diheme cytochrome c family protein